MFVIHVSMIEPNQMMTKEYGWMEQQQQNENENENEKDLAPK